MLLKEGKEKNIPMPCDELDADSTKHNLQGWLRPRSLMTAIVLLTLVTIEFLQSKSMIARFAFTGSEESGVSNKRLICGNAFFSDGSSFSEIDCQNVNQQANQGSIKDILNPRIESCTWAPDNSTECEKALQELLCQKGDLIESDKIPRILYLGDSVTIQLFVFGRIKNRMISPAKKQAMEKTGRLQCILRNAKNGRCTLNDQYGLSYPPNKTWVSPVNISAQQQIPHGPVAFGLQNPFCQDCMGCSPSLLECSLRENPSIDFDIANLTNAERMSLVYGGFIGIEFARDVEMQSDRFLTTQENVAYYLKHKFNSDGLRKYWQQPTCIVNTGHHDVLVPNITKESYVENVRWYLRLLAAECRSIIWIATNAPLSNDYEQKINNTKAWGLAVKQLLQEDVLLRSRSLYLDVFEASLTFEHRDNSK